MAEKKTEQEKLSRRKFIYIGVGAVAVAAAGGAAYYLSQPSPAPPAQTTTLPATKAGKGKLMVELFYETSGHYQQSPDEALVLKTQLERTGLITVNLHATDWAGMGQLRQNESMPVWIGGNYIDYPDPDSALFWMLDSKSAAAWFHTNYNNPEMDRLLAEARAAEDPTIRDQLYDQIQKITVDEAPYVPIYQSSSLAVSKADVEGILLKPLSSMVHLAPMHCPRDTLIIGTTDTTAINLDPAESWDYIATDTIATNTGGLLLLTEPGSAGGPENFKPELATDWSVSSDGLAYTFNLRHGVKFSDGKEFDANDVKYSFDRSMGLYLATGPQAGLGFRDVIDSVEVVSKYQVVFHLKNRMASFLLFLQGGGCAIVNPKYAPMDKTAQYVEGNARASNPCDLGPYILTSWTRKGGKDYDMQLDANPNYWGPPPNTPHIVYKYYSDSTTLTNAMKSGDIDIAYRHLSSADIKSYQSDPTFKVWQGPGEFESLLAFQEKIPPFDNPKVRRAVAAAIDRKELVDTVYLGLTQPVYSLIHNGLPFQKEGFKALNDAVTMLQELGYG